MIGPPERTAVLVIRAWLEGGEEIEPVRFRARISSVADLSEPGARETQAAASEKEIVNAVRRWLRAFVAGR
jgi:hypothetical protein